MKKILFLIPLILFSCSEDSLESSESENLDPIIGIWKPVANISKYEDEPEQVDEFNSCTQQSRINFKVNGEISETNKGLNTENECVNERLSMGSWRKLTGNKYEFIVIEEINGEGETETVTRELIFSDGEMRNIYYEDEESGEYDYDLFLSVE